MATKKINDTTEYKENEYVEINKVKNKVKKVEKVQDTEIEDLLLVKEKKEEPKRKILTSDFLSKKQKKAEKVDIVRVLDVSKDQGLNDEQVKERVEKGFVNLSTQKTSKTGWQIIKDNIFTFFNMLYLVITILLCINKLWSNLTYLLVVIPNTVISIIQEFKAKKMIEKLSLVSATKATVVRNGEKIEIDQKDVVLDDVIFLKNGNQIYADAIVLDGTSEVNESMITGESDSIVKNKEDYLYSGSYLVSGSVYARVEHVGKDNYIEKLAAEAKEQKGSKSELLRSLNLIVKIISFIIVPLFVVQVLVSMKNGNLEIGNVAGSIIGMIPSGLFLLTSVALVSGVITLGKKHNTQIQELYCIEMLARVDTLCLDKTGTITDGTMRVVDCVEIKNTTNYTFREIVGSMMGCFEETNATSEALIRFFSVNKVLKPVAILPFSSKRKYSAVTFEDVGTFYLGAPEFILSGDNLEKVRNKVERFAAQGCRVIALGHSTAGIKKEGIASTVKALALIVIQDHIRDEAYETIEYFRNNGVEVKVISGDNPVTVSEIAHRAGITNYNRYISLEGLSDEEVKDVAFDYTIFGRVTPSQKKALVEALKEKKRTVAMTGDGVNDILAMKEADCSIAMASGSEATRNIANVVLMDSNFASMPKVVAEGRRVINNVQRTSTLYLTKTIFTLFITLFYLILAIGNKEMMYPFEPSQMMIIEFFIIGVPATIISLQPNKERVEGKFINNVFKKSLPGACTVLVFQIALWVLAFRTEAVPGLNEWDYFVTISLIINIAICLTVLYNMCKPFNLMRGSVFLASFVICVLSVLLCDKIDGAVKNVSFFSDGLLKMAWPLGLDRSLTTIIFILLINPVYALVLRILKAFTTIKISD